LSIYWQLLSFAAPSNVSAGRYIRGGDVSVIGVDLLAGAAVSYLIRKARRIGHRADGHVDEILDEGTDRVCDLIEGALGLDPSLTLLDEQAQAGTESDRTIRRAEDAISEKAEADAEFRQRLELLLIQLESVPGGARVSAPGGVAAGRDVSIRASGGGVAAAVMGAVTVNPPPPGPGES
jgi:hypothetical protein